MLHIKHPALHCTKTCGILVRSTDLRNRTKKVLGKPLQKLKS